MSVWRLSFLTTSCFCH